MQKLPQKVRSRKLNSRVDLTAMVSVSFLLIIFFMVVGELSKPKMMDLNMGENCHDCFHYNHEGENRALIILLGDNDKLVYYIGVLEGPIKKPQIVSYGKNGIRKELLMRKRMVQEYSPGLVRYQKFAVIIKPSKKSNYGNLVDILDEMKITGISSYSIVPDFTPNETKLLASN